MTRPAVSVVVVAYDMARELPRTLRTLVPGYQRDLAPEDVELVVVDNGSPTPVAPSDLPDHPRVELIRLDPAPPSPARAANVGVAAATGELVGLVVDGARMASPGLLATALLGARLAEQPVVASLGWHLGLGGRHMEADRTGHDRAAEDRLLADAGWEEDGYRLFGISTLAGSSGRGWFGPLGESSALFLPARRWAALGGLDEAFALPGGGLVNHDLYRRAVTAPGASLVVLLGEGTFHQHHGGAATSGRFDFEAMQADHERLRGRRYAPPEVAPTYVGRMPPEALPHVAESVRLAEARLARLARRRG